MPPNLQVQSCAFGALSLKAQGTSPTQYMIDVWSRFQDRRHLLDTQCFETRNVLIQRFCFSFAECFVSPAL